MDALAILFGIGSWIGVTSVFLQLPLIVETAPEGWSLPSYLVITVQAANIFSFVYVVYQKYSPRKINDGHFIYVTMVIGCVAGICMSFLYHQTTDIGGSPHSVSLLVFTLMFAVTGCMSSMLFMPYMGRFREIYLVTYLLGQGLNGFVSSILTLIQGVGGTPECLWDNSTGTYTKYIPPPRFGPNIFFLFVFAILVLSTIAFILLNTLRVCKNQYAAGTVGLGNVYHYDKSEKDNELRGAVPEDVRNLSKFNFVFLISVEAFSNLFGNSILPAIQAFSFLPYGSVTYHLSVTLATIASPLACFVAMFIPHISIRSIRVLSVFSIATSVYIVCIALSSPTPPLKDSLVGPILIVRVVFLNILDENITCGNYVGIRFSVDSHFVEISRPVNLRDCDFSRFTLQDGHFSQGGNQQNSRR